MRKNWPYFIVASFLNAVFITGAFIEFKLRGVGTSRQPTWFEINPFILTGGIFVISFLVIMAIIIIKDLPSYVKASAGKAGDISKRLHTINESLANTPPAQVTNPFDVA
ncbi:hypothetical protein A4H97_18615 [Niastella yeongjuensis]|uniref:Uncharacterized protein n=1 Tax=Niastella yeongjuensis TaxID=354355 RepID=A0A1V9DXX7_9BACT|nr:hypothetical protein [Niastella yeongjuensis]OQP38733.1 hypothetical protein A4H97_18615 [Niastella yeongjuensis]SEO34683.1 hypothetical protein SAMN05660816_02680 [Niastella yeongjuensis]